MTKPYSLDLRRRVTRFVEAGYSCHAMARHLEVSVAFVIRLMAAYRATGSLAPKPEGGWRSSELAPHRNFLFRRVTKSLSLAMSKCSYEMGPFSNRGSPVKRKQLWHLYFSPGYGSLHGRHWPPPHRVQQHEPSKVHNVISWRIELSQAPLTE